MAEHEATRSWIDSWAALQQQFLQAWQAGAAAAAPGTAPQGGFEPWSRLAGGDAGDPAIDRMLAAARQFVGLMQAAIAQAGGGTAKELPSDWARMCTQAFGTLDPVDNPVAAALRALAGRGAQGLETLHAELRETLAPWQRELLAVTRWPAFGYTREAQQRQQRLAAAWAEYADQLDRYNGLLLEASRKALERLESKLAEHSEPGRQLTSFRALYDAWIDAAEAGYGEVAASAEFRRVYGALVNAQMQVRRRIQQEIERATGSVGMPTRTELDAVHRKLAALQRRVSELEHQRTDAVHATGPRPAAAAAPATPAAAPRPTAVPLPRPAAKRRRPRAAAVAESAAPARRAGARGDEAPVERGRRKAGGLAAQLAELRQAVGRRKGGR